MERTAETALEVLPDKEKNHTHFCSFCGKGNLDVEHMVAGDAAAICVGCIEICVESVESCRAFATHE